MPRHPLAPTPKDLATRCPRSGMRYFSQPEVTARECDPVVPCPGCGKPVRLRVTVWSVCLIPRHNRPPDSGG